MRVLGTCVRARKAVPLQRQITLLFYAYMFNPLNDNRMKKFCSLVLFALCAMSLFATPEGALPKVFSVAANKQVYFSNGNLQIKPVEYLWRFAPYQYEIAGIDNALIAGSADVFIDLFGWATSGWVLSTAKAHMPWDASTNDADYILGNDFHLGMTGDNANADWGVENAISNGGSKVGLWRTLTADEWEFLLFDRDDAENKCAIGMVGDVHGLIILPDNFELPSGLKWNGAATSWGANRYAQSKNEWDKMDAAGALFLPCAGARTGTEVNGINYYGGYWSTDYFDQNTASALVFDETSIDVNGLYRSQGYSVRLVQDAEPQAINQVQNNKVQGTKVIRNGMLYLMYNGTMYNVQGAEVK